MTVLVSGIVIRLFKVWIVEALMRPVKRVIIRGGR